MSDKEAFERIERKFSSLNTIDTDRANVRKEDWVSAKRYLQAASAQFEEAVPIAWLVKFTGQPERFELAEPGEISSNPEWWTDAFPVYIRPPCPVPK